MYRVVVECWDVPAAEGAEAATDIERNFREHRPHHQNVRCTFENGKLVLRAETTSPDGLALIDEFSDLISAYVSTAFDGDLKVVSSTPI